jgi:hypothetical protein
VAIDWDALAQSAIEQTIRNAPSIIFACAYVWRRTWRVENVVKDGVASMAQAQGELRGFMKAIPLAREDRREFLQAAGVAVPPPSKQD